MPTINQLLRKKRVKPKIRESKSQERQIKKDMQVAQLSKVFKKEVGFSAKIEKD